MYTILWEKILSSMCSPCAHIPEELFVSIEPLLFFENCAHKRQFLLQIASSFSPDVLVFKLAAQLIMS